MGMTEPACRFEGTTAGWPWVCKTHHHPIQSVITPHLPAACSDGLAALRLELRKKDDAEMALGCLERDYQTLRTQLEEQAKETDLLTNKLKSAQGELRTYTRNAERPGFPPDEETKLRRLLDDQARVIAGLRGALADCVGLLESLTGTNANCEGAIDVQIADAKEALSPTEPKEA